MLQKDKAKLADDLLAGLKLVAESRSAATPQGVIGKWFDCVNLLHRFVHAWEDNLNPETAAAIFGLLESLQSDFIDVEAGKPSLAHRIDPETGAPLFPRLTGQQIGSLDEANLAICCAAVTLLNRSGVRLRDASAKVCRQMRKLHLPFPPTKNVPKSGLDAAGDVEALLSWRKRISGRKVGDVPHRVYEKTIRDLTAGGIQDIEARVNSLLEVVASKFGSRAN